MATIELVDIAQELKKEQEGEKRTRASLFNLILYVEKEYAASYRTLISSVISKYPCRVIFIIHDTKNGEEYLKTSVQSEVMGSSSHQIFCETISIEVAGSLVERVYFLLLPHLLCDLPIYLLWTLDPSKKTPLFSHLEKIATRIIFDSHKTTNLQKYATTLLSQLEQSPCQIGDLHWSALSGWRTMIRHFFDSYDGYQILLKSKKIEIIYALHPQSTRAQQEIEAAYLLSWLASQLQWNYRSFDIVEGYQHILYSTLEGESLFLLQGKESSQLPAGALLSVTIESRQENATIAFVRHKETHQVFTHYSDHSRCDLPHYSYLPGMEEGKEILKEIFYPSQRQHYQKMLTALKQIPWRNQ